MRSVMERRRRHEECRRGGKGGCEVLVGGTCPDGVAWRRGRKGRKGGVFAWAGLMTAVLAATVGCKVLFGVVGLSSLMMMMMIVTGSIFRRASPKILYARCTEL